MIKIGRFRIYFGTKGLGWKLYGIGWADSSWFLGLSINAPNDKDEDLLLKKKVM